MLTKTVLKIDWATHEAAKYACENWHYSKAIPVNKLVKVGAWEDCRFIGVVIFGLGATNNLGKPYGLNMQQCCELVRVAFRDHKTPISRILSIAIKFLKKTNPGIRLIVSFADTTQGHHGGIYQATNWVYSGTTARDVLYRDPQGKLWHRRRASMQPCKGKRLVTSGWKRELQGAKHRYLMPLDDEMKKKIELLRKPYPKRAESKDIVASVVQTEEDSETLISALHTSAEFSL